MSMLPFALDNLTTLPPEPVAVEPAPAGRTPPGESFDEYLQRARAKPAESAAGDSGRSGNTSTTSTPSADTRPPAGSRDVEKNRRDDAAAVPAGTEPGGDAAGQPSERTTPRDPPAGTSEQHSRESERPSPETTHKTKKDDQQRRGVEADVVSLSLAAEADGVAKKEKPLPAASSTKGKEHAASSEHGKIPRQEAETTQDGKRSRPLPDGKAGQDGKQPAAVSVAAQTVEATAEDQAEKLVAGSASKTSRQSSSKQAVAASDGKRRGTASSNPAARPEDQPSGKADAGSDVPNPEVPLAPQLAPGQGPRAEASRRGHRAASKAEPASEHVAGVAVEQAVPAATAADAGESLEVVSQAVTRPDTTPIAEPAAQALDLAPKPPPAPQVGAQPATPLNPAGGTAQRPGAAPAEKTGEPSQADRVRMVQRVARAFQSMGDSGGSVRLRLSPPELGSLHIEVTVRRGEMTARLETETTAARNLLLDNLPALRDRLAQQDIKIQQFDVDLMGRSFGGTPDQTAQYTESPDRHNNRPPRPPARQGREGPSTINPGTAARPGDGGRLNVVI